LKTFSSELMWKYFFIEFFIEPKPSRAQETLKEKRAISQSNWDN
jgi:hypothetical protein